MSVEGAKIYFTIPILGGINITQTIVSSFVIMVLLCTVGYFLGRNLKKRPGPVQVLTEYLVGLIYGMVEDTMGKHNSHWTPYIATLFLSSICGSYIGMTGVFRSTTADLSTVLVWAVMTSILVFAGNIRTSGFWGWIKGYINPLNIISDVSQPVSMAFRHFGNIMGGGVLTSLIYYALATASTLLIGAITKNGIAISIVMIAVGAALFLWGLKKKKLIRKILGIAVAVIGVFAMLDGLNILKDVPILALGLPGLLSIYFDVFTGLVQALVFSLLTMVYVGTACPPPEETN